MPTEITLVAFDPQARTVTFRAYGKQKTISGLGDFPSKSALVEYLQSVAETDMRGADVDPLPDLSSEVGKVLPSVEQLKSEEQP